MSIFGICSEFVKHSGVHSHFYLNVLMPFIQDNELRVAIDYPAGRVLEHYFKICEHNTDLKQWMIHLGKIHDRTIEFIEIRDPNLSERDLFIELSSKIYPKSCLIAWSRDHYRSMNRSGLEIIDRVEAVRRIKKLIQGTTRTPKEKRRGTGTTINIYKPKELNMSGGDTFNTNQALAVGPNARADHNTTTMQSLGKGFDVDLSSLIPQLKELRSAMKTQSTEPEHDVATAEVAKAEQAAAKGDQSGVIAHLKAAGQWAAEVATKIGVSVASKAIESAMGIK